MTKLLLILISLAFVLPVAAEIRGILPGMKFHSRPNQPHTSFQTPTKYLPENDIRTDAVILYTDKKPEMESWADRGYIVQTMYGFRTGPDYIKMHPEEGQTLANGEILTCGPGSYYMVPTQNRISAALNYFRNAIANGTSAVIPEEPEFFTQTGYSDAFKSEWEAYYGEPWQDQVSSIEARWKSSRLKGYLEYRMVKSILDHAQSRSASVVRMVAAHSAVSYYNWGIIYPHYECMMLPELQEMIGQVWTGTARTTCKYEGVSAERTFENAYLEYSSLWNLMRNTGKRLWFLMDPLEDNPDRSMEDYQSNYELTLVASLMFRGVDEYEVMPWPTRIFGRVPADFATKIMTIVTMLGDMHNQRYSVLDAGTKGIATFIADSMAWQRGEPHPSNFDCFYGLTLPLLMKGIPVQVAQLERSPEPKYLDEYKVLLVSYDIMKPMDPSYNIALSDWTRKGGTLIVFGGTDAYNDLPEWWKKAGFRSPVEDLLARLGVDIEDTVSFTQDMYFDVLAREDKPIRTVENRKEYVLDISKYVHEGQVYVKFEDSQKGDGWGPSIFNVELRVNGKTVTSFNPGTKTERAHIFADVGSICNGIQRFADGTAYWIYQFDISSADKVVRDVSWKTEEKKAELVLDMGNQFQVSVTSTGPSEHIFRGCGNSALVRRFPKFVVPACETVTAYKTLASPLYRVSKTPYVPFFEQKVGAGSVIFVGIAPSFFASSKESADILRAIVAYGCTKAGIDYREQSYMKIRRGRYVAVRTFDKALRLPGKFVDILNPRIPVVANPEIPRDALSVLADVTDSLKDSRPRILQTSDRIEASTEKSGETQLLVTGPLRTKGVVRFSTGNKQIRTITVRDTAEKAVPFTYKIEDNTLLVNYDSLPDGVFITITWS